MKPDRAWVRLGSGRRLDLLDPRPDQWTDCDLAVGLSRTYRWGGHSRWDRPLSVAQHSLLVLVLRQQMQPHQPLTPGEALRELTHDADKGLLGFDPTTPLKLYFGNEFHARAGRLRSAIATRCALPEWRTDDAVLHKRADHLAAASEAVHVAGWRHDEVHETLGIQLRPLRDDPSPLLDGLQPSRKPFGFRRGTMAGPARSRPVPGQDARTRRRGPCRGAADLAAVIGREATLARLGAAFSRLPPRSRLRCARPLTGNSLTDTFVHVERTTSRSSTSRA